MKKKRATVKLLASPQDRERLQGILDALRSQGIRITDAGTTLKKQDIVLAVLSPHFYADEELRSRLFDQLALGADNILPLKLGEEPVPEDMMNLLFARNVIPADRREDAQVAERILSAIPEKKNIMPLILSVSAVVLLLLGGIFLLRSMPRTEPEPEITATEPVPNPWGITEEELAEIQDVVIVGDSFAYYTAEHTRNDPVWPDVYSFAYDTWDEDGRHWFSREDGREYTLTRYEDLRFLELMPNLRKLHIALADVDPEMLPDLSSSTNLNNVTIIDCNIDNVEWIAAKSLVTVDISGTNVADYNPLTRCESMTYAYIDGLGKYTGDISGFAPPRLRELTISNLQPGQTNLDALTGCTALTWLNLDSLEIRDLEYLRGMTGLKTLILGNLPTLQDISALNTLTGLRELRIRQCDYLADYTPISSCRRLEMLNIERHHWIPMDSAFLEDLPNLRDVGLFGLNLNNLDFLAGVSKNNSFNFGFCGDIQDYSGLAEVKRYGYIHVNPRSNGGPFGDYALIAPYLQGAVISELDLYNCTNLDLAALPLVSSRLIISGSDLQDLSGLQSEHLSRLELRNMQYLRSLDGLEGLPKLDSGMLQLSILGCPRLTDFNALNGAELFALNLVDTYSYPDFSQLSVKTLCLESIQDMEDLRCLEGLNRDAFYQFKFPGLDDLKDLSLLQQFHGGTLSVPPQVADQAQELVEMGNFHACEVTYPQSGWDPLQEEVTLLSLEELETLPRPILQRVRHVWIAGDEIVDPNRYELRSEWVNDRPLPFLYEYETGELRPVYPGSITDFSMLEDLTQVRDLRLFNQPLTSLEGIQYFTELTCFDGRFCEDLTDISALFTLQNLEEIWIGHSDVDSIQGVQNLPRLRCLSVSWTGVSDLSPLLDVDYTVSRESGGFILEAENCFIDDFSPLSVIPAFSYLGLYSFPAESWMGHVEQAYIRAVGGQMGSDELLKNFTLQHPELEELYAEDGYHLTDLTPLLDLSNLHYVHVWSDAAVAGYSLEGYARNFHLEID